MLRKSAPQTIKTILFVPLAKVDELKREVTGIVTAEVLDKAGEILHYETSVPYFKAWSAMFEQVTKGKSLGNVRAMHQPNAVGKLTAIEFDDGNKTILATAKIVDDAEWAKVLEGVYTGFSIGGRYIKQWEDNGKQYFTADPVEVSIVDNPCVPVAHFLAAKADGSEVEVPFKLWEPTNAEIASKATELAGDKNWIDFIEAAKVALKSGHGMPAEKAVDEEDAKDGGADEDTEDKKKKKKAAGDEKDDCQMAADGEQEVDDKEEQEDMPEEDKAKKAEEARGKVAQVWQATDGKTFAAKAECVAYQADLDDPIKQALAKANAVVKDVEQSKKPYGDVAYAIEKDGVSLFPLDTELHIRSSWVFANKTTKLSDEEKKSVIEKIKASWLSVIGGEPPAAEKINAFGPDHKASDALKAATGDKLEKGLYLVSMWANVIDQVLWATDCVGWCYEESELPQTVKDICAALLTFMVDLVDEEVAMCLSHLKMADSSALTGMAKLIDSAMSKAIEKATAAPVTIEKASFDKLQAELDATKARSEKLEKQVSDAVEGITSLTATVEKLKKEPMPRPVLGRVVDKADDRRGVEPTPADAQAALNKLIADHGQDAVSLMLIKAAQKNPIQVR